MRRISDPLLTSSPLEVYRSYAVVFTQGDP